jgi:hypothetical protein
MRKAHWFTVTLAVALLPSLLAGLPASASVAGLPLQSPDSTGGLIGYTFPISEQPVDASHPAVAYCSDREEYLVVWSNEQPGTYDDGILGQRVSKNGTLEGSVISIATGTGNERLYPDVTYNPQQGEYLVVWESRSNHPGGASIVAERVSATGQPHNWFFVAMASPTSPAVSHYRPAVAYASTADKYLVVWHRDDNNGARKHIQGQVLSSTGAPAGSLDISMDPGGGFHRLWPDVAYCRSRNEYLVVWQQWDANNNNCDIYARKVTGDGAPMDQPFGLPGATGQDQVAPAVAAIPISPDEAKYLIVWEDRASLNNANIFGAVIVDLGSTRVEWAVPISTALENQTNPAVVGNENADQYLVVWTHEDYVPPLAYDSIVGRVFSSEGVPLSEETSLGGFFADHAAMASGPIGDFLMAFDDQPLLAANQDIYGQLWGNRLYLPLVVRNYQ